MQVKNRAFSTITRRLKKRVTLRKLIDAFIFLGHRELSFRGNFESEASINCENYEELLHLVSKYDVKLANHQATASVLPGISNRIQNDLINSVQISMLSEIEKKVAKANFVAILLDKTGDVSNFAQLSIVFRYVTKDCVIKEQFLRVILKLGSAVL